MLSVRDTGVRHPHERAVAVFGEFEFDDGGHAERRVLPIPRVGDDLRGIELDDAADRDPLALAELKLAADACLEEIDGLPALDQIA